MLGTHSPWQPSAIYGQAGCLELQFINSISHCFEGAFGKSRSGMDVYGGFLWKSTPLLCLQLCNPFYDFSHLSIQWYGGKYNGCGRPMKPDFALLR